MPTSRIRILASVRLSYLLLSQGFLSCTCLLLHKNVHAGGGAGEPVRVIAHESSKVQALNGILGRKSNSFKTQSPMTSLSCNATSSLRKGDPWKTSIGILIGGAVIVGLAGTTEPTSDPLEEAYGTVFNVFDAAVPGSSTDLVAVALGEAIAGIIGAVLTAVVRSVASNDREPLVAEALADSDYFIAQAGLRPTLQAVGVSPLLATLGSVVFASVPSQLVKLTSQQKQRRAEEEKSLLQLLNTERKEKVKESRIPLGKRAAALRQIRPVAREVGVDPKELKPVTESELDFVEIFSDVTRWLGYDVLTSDFGDSLLYSGIPYSPGIMGITFGSLAAFTARLYADLMYGVLRYGPEVRQTEVRTRRFPDWFAFYASCSLSSATLFGVYEQSKGPISRWIQGVLAGGFDACLGSDSFETCFDTYIKANAPAPSAEAELRALATNLIMVGQRLQDIAGDTSADDVQTLVRAWVVSLYSYMHHLF